MLSVLIVSDENARTISSTYHDVIENKTSGICNFANTTSCIIMSAIMGDNGKILEYQILVYKFFN